MLTHCAQCRKPFVRTASQAALRNCPACVRLEQANHQSVYQYLCANPGGTIAQISEATRIPEDQIARMLGDNARTVLNPA